MAAGRLIIALAAWTAVAVTARLGWWQLDRAAQKEAVQASVEQRSAMPPVSATELPAQPDALWHHRLAALEGRWLADHLLFLDNRPMGGRAGFIVLTPLELDDGRVVLVQRGWQARDLRDRTLTQPVPTPTDATVRVRGRLAPPPSRLMEFEAQTQGPLRHNVEMAGLSSEVGRALLPVTLLQLEPALSCGAPAAGAADPAATTVGEPSIQPTVRCATVIDDGLRREWAVVASSPHKNRGYAVQWFALSALVAGLYLWFQILQPWRRRRQVHPT